MKRRWLLFWLGVMLAVGGWGGARAQTAEPPSRPTYTVQSGDTLFDIAVRFGVSLPALQAANPAVDPALLQVGQRLFIPGLDGLSGDLSVHYLAVGETLDSVAWRYGLQTATLVRLNRVLNPHTAYIGQPVIVLNAPEVGAPVTTGQLYTVRPGEGWLQVAARHNHNPWALAALNRQPAPADVAPGAALLLPGDTPLRALPEPLADFSLGPLPARQGKTLVVRVRATTALSLTGSLGAWPLNFAPLEGAWVALHGIERFAPINVYPLSLHYTDSTGFTGQWVQGLALNAGLYGADPPLRVDPATIDPAVTEPEAALIANLARTFTPQRYWTEAFRLPSVGGLRSLFGVLRTYNNNAYTSYHAGVDFSGAEDRPITAPAPGVVVLVQPLTVRGLATFIDHGWGVFTGYWHQSSTQVSVGDRVETGQIIGFQGSTGRVTGPHLHWEVWVNGAPVDPLDWTAQPIP